MNQPNLFVAYPSRGWCRIHYSMNGVNRVMYVRASIYTHKSKVSAACQRLSAKGYTVNDLVERYTEREARWFRKWSH